MRTESAAPRFDVIVVGGSYAGLSAAMQLARARQRVLVVDAGLRRNRFAAASHGFLGQDGRPPEAIVADGRTQVLAYPNVQWKQGMVAAVSGSIDDFTVQMETGQGFECRRLILATGVVDQLPEVPGLSERWGRAVFHCPYCHGYELNQGHIGVLAVGPISLHQALMLPDWGTVRFLTNQTFTPTEADAQALAARAVTVDPRRVARIIDHATVAFEDGSTVVLDGLFVASRTRLASPVAEQLGCDLGEGPLGSFIKTDELKETSLPGVFACGDAARMAGSVTLAVGDGAVAGLSAHRSLLLASTTPVAGR